MRIVIVGGGPVGLFVALLARRQLPWSEVRVVERELDPRPGPALALGSDALGDLDEADPETFELAGRELATWDRLEVHHGGEVTTVRTEATVSIPRARLLEALRARCEATGVTLELGRDVHGPDEVGDADLIVAADGAESVLRSALAAELDAEVTATGSRYVWFESGRRLHAALQIFVEHEAGLFNVRARPSGDDESTWVVECGEEALRRAGLEEADEAEIRSFCETLLAPHLEGHAPGTGDYRFRSLLDVRCARRSHGRVVVVGDAAQTVHFAAAAGLRLGFDDALALVDALEAHGPEDLAGALADYGTSRRAAAESAHRISERSRAWYAGVASRLRDPPLQLAFSLLTRTGEATYDHVRAFDPVFVRKLDAAFAVEAGLGLEEGKSPPPPAYVPFEIHGLRLENRIVVSPMCQYSANEGVVNDWHLVHLGSRAVGGAALVFAEMTDVSPEGRITPYCAGIWDERHVEPWARIVRFVHSSTRASIGIQLAHAGRKASARRPWDGGGPLREGAWEALGPSAVPFGPGWPAPKALDREEMARLVRAFADGARRAEAAGFDVVELHMAHGYLLSSFLSPLSNRRKDAYGGSLENRARFPLEVVDAVRAAWPADKPLFARLSATDWLDDEGGFTLDEAVEVARMLRDHGCDMIDVSSAGNVPESQPDVAPMYQAHLAERIRRDAAIPVLAVGRIDGVDHANTILAAGRADLCAVARAHLREPYLALHGAAHYGVDMPWPPQYLRAT